MAHDKERTLERIVGRYALYGEIASGGMATVHFGRLLGPVGFSKTVAIKRLHPQYAKDPEFASMFLDEARLAARIQHPNAVATLDVVALHGELFLVMEYVQGESLARLLRNLRENNARPPPRIVGSIMTGVLSGLHAAHDARTERGEPLSIVHRDVSPQNIIVGIDGIARVLDFGVAKAAGRVQTTREGQIKGKLAYMAPEQIRGMPVDRRTDVYSASVVLWESLTGNRLFEGDNDAVVLARVLDSTIEPPSLYAPDLPRGVDAVVLKGLEREPERRFQSAMEMALVLEDVLGLASPRQLSEWVVEVAGNALLRRANRVKEIESISSVDPVPHSVEGLPQGGAPSIPTLPPIPRQLHLPAPPNEGGSGSGSLRQASPNYASGVSQLSSISLSKGLSVAPPRPRSRSALVVGGSLVGALALLFLLVQASSPSSRRPEEHVQEPQRLESNKPESSKLATDPNPGTALGALPTEPSPPPEVAPAAPTVEPTASGSASSPPSAHRAPPSKAVAQAPAAKPKERMTPRRDCDPPYTLDSSGIRRIKPECL